MKNRKSGLTAVVTLFLITAVMAGLLALVNSVTAGPIAAAQREKDGEGPLWGSSGRVWSWESSWNPSRMKPVWWKGSTKPPTDMWWR